MSSNNDIGKQQEFDRRFAEARRLTAEGSLVESREIYRQLLRSKPEGKFNYASTLLNVGLTEFHLGNITEGRHLIEESIRVLPGRILAYHWLNHVYWSEKKFYMLPVILFWYLRNIRSIYDEEMRLRGFPQSE